MRIAWLNTRNEPVFLRSHSYYQLKPLSIHESQQKEGNSFDLITVPRYLWKKKYIIYISDKNILELLEFDLNLECLMKKYKVYNKEAC